MRSLLAPMFEINFTLSLSLSLSLSAPTLNTAPPSSSPFPHLFPPLLALYHAVYVFIPGEGQCQLSAGDRGPEAPLLKKTNIRIFKERIRIFKEKIRIFKERIRIFKEKIQIFKERIRISKEKIQIFKKKIRILKKIFKSLKKRFDTEKNKAIFGFVSQSRSLLSKLTSSIDPLQKSRR